MGHIPNQPTLLTSQTTTATQLVLPIPMMDQVTGQYSWPFGTSTTTNSVTQITWRAWNNNILYSDTSTLGGSVTQSIITGSIWTNWVQVEEHRMWQSWNAAPQVAQERREEWARQEAAQRKINEEAALARKEAEERAFKLLHACLSEEQRDDLVKKGSFYLTTISKNGEQRKYRIDKGTHGNVKRVDPVSGSILESLCVQPDNVPVGDSMLAQKLWLEADEEEFRKVANITPYNPPRARVIGR